MTKPGKKGIGGGGDTSFKSASTSVVSFVGGQDEDVDSRNSIFPDTGVIPDIDYLPEKYKLPLNDTMFYGDEIEELPDTVTEAINKTKEADGLDGSFRNYRAKNTISVEYDTTTDGKIKDDTIGVSVNTRKYEDTVTVTDTTGDSNNTFEAPLKLFLPDNPEPTPYTIMVEDWKDKSEPFRLQFDSRKKRAVSHRRYVKAAKGTYQNPDSKLIEGIRVATMYGVADPYTAELSTVPPAISGAVPANPVIHTWIELTLLADGTTYVRIPDASIFPRHVGYLRGPQSGGKSTKRATSGLEYIYDKTVTTADDTYDVSIREDTNNVWERFQKEANEGVVTPYNASNSTYHSQYDKVDSSLYDRHPVMAYGEAANGSELGRSEVLNKLPAEPLFPMPEIDFISVII